MDLVLFGVEQHRKVGIHLDLLLLLCPVQLLQLIESTLALLAELIPQRARFTLAMHRVHVLLMQERDIFLQVMGRILAANARQRALNIQ